jgi:hypothetical protein
MQDDWAKDPITTTRAPIMSITEQLVTTTIDSTTTTVSSFTTTTLSSLSTESGGGSTTESGGGSTTESSAVVWAVIGIICCICFCLCCYGFWRWLGDTLKRWWNQQWDHIQARKRGFYRENSRLR